jgi:hypothetical protein
MARKSTRAGRVQPSVRPTETYTESNFLRLYSTGPGYGEERIVTLEHLRYSAGEGDQAGWRCATIVDGERMSKEDALFIARSYAVEHGVPVIYECHGE